MTRVQVDSPARPKEAIRDGSSVLLCVELAGGVEFLGGVFAGL